MLEQFHADSFTVTGGAHGAEGRENQDSVVVVTTELFTLLLVSDGVGSRRGSKVGSLLLCEGVRRSILRIQEELGDLCAADSVEEFATLFIEWLNSDLDEVLSEGASYFDAATSRYLSATLLGCLITEGAVIVFGCGDGYFGVNSELYELSSPEANRPELPAYRLEDPVPGTSRGAMRVLYAGDSLGVESVFVASDGFQELAFELQLLGSEVGGGEETRAFIERLLALRHPTSFPRDDLSLAVARRIRPRESAGATPPFMEGESVASGEYRCV